MKGTQSKSAMAQRMEADRMTATASYGTPSKSEYKGTGLGAHRHRVELGDNEHNRRSSEHSRTSEAASTRSSSSSSHSMTDGTSLEKKKKLPRKDSPWLENGHDAMDAIALARTASSKRDEYRVRRVRSRCICTPIQTGS